MNRSERVRRIKELVKTGEYQARRDLAVANRDLNDAESAVVSIFDQCRDLAHPSEDVPLAFGRALLQSGWLAAQERTQQRDAAAVVAGERHSTWAKQQTRLDALGRLLGRLELEESTNRQKHTEAELTDIISTRIPQIAASLG